MENSIINLFFDSPAVSVDTVETSREESDFRVALIVTLENGKKYVIKLADNDFTDPEKIKMWQRTAEEYRAFSYYCPRILCDKSGQFPTVGYRGHDCVAYAEEFAPYRAAEDRSAPEDTGRKPDPESYTEDIWTMTAKVAAKHFDYTDSPSAYCLFETFCPGDKTDEVLENALAWKKYADTLPAEHKEQTERIWKLWTDNRKALEKIYPSLPTSVFQADLNATNLLVDDNGRFVGVFDFNLAGKDVFLNYLMRENFDEFEPELEMIFKALKISSRYYRFTDAEKDAALMLYRCLKPLWFCKLETLKSLGTDLTAVKSYLDKTEYYLTADIDFKQYMI